ncbi:hypothetical protein QJS10_CPB04g00721 [Acorus calamus]|uniref:Uncharacterized protein n=1 Tax=Acorus calamus TaxID=4465 RepID=A0AAV9F114_ACOCL|nr:hypothetical protein QJS10_CPB04g00721 [Acorus calamus]
MADYSSYSNGGYTKGRFGGRYQAWDATAYNRAGDQVNGWNNPGEAYRDHVCRPVIVDVDGRLLPVVLNCPRNKDGTTGTIETVLEQKPVRAYREETTTITEFNNGVQTAKSIESKTGFPGGMFQRQDKSPNGYPGYDGSFGRKESDFEQKEMGSGDWSGYGHSRWGAPQGYEGSLSRPMRGVGDAVDYVRESARPFSGTTTSAPRQYFASRPAFPASEMDSGTGNIDSKEAARKYNGRFF